MKIKNKYKIKKKYNGGFMGEVEKHITNIRVDLSKKFQDISKIVGDQITNIVGKEEKLSTPEKRARTRSYEHRMKQERLEKRIQEKKKKRNRKK